MKINTQLSKQTSEILDQAFDIAKVIGEQYVSEVTALQQIFQEARHNGAEGHRHLCEEFFIPALMIKARFEGLAAFSPRVAKPKCPYPESMDQFDPYVRLQAKEWMLGWTIASLNHVTRQQQKQEQYSILQPRVRMSKPFEAKLNQLKSSMPSVDDTMHLNLGQLVQKDFLKNIVYEQKPPYCYYGSTTDLVPLTIRFRFVGDDIVLDDIEFGPKK